MPVDFGLLTETAQVPMKAKAVMPNTPAENQAIMYDMQGKQVRAQEAKQNFDLENKDRSAADAALREDGVDLATHEGTQKFLEKIKGKVSPDFYLKQADHAAKVQQMDVANKIAIFNLNNAQRGEYSAAIEPMVSELKTIDDEHTADTKREQAKEIPPGTADANLKAKAGLLAKKYGEVKGPTGAPLTPPQLIQDLENAPPHLIHGWIARSQQEKNDVDLAHKKSQTAELEAKAARQQAETKLLEGGAPKGTKVYSKPGDDNTYIKTPYGQMFQKTPLGDMTPITRLPDGVIEQGAQPRNTPQAVIDAALDLDKNPLTEQELYQGKQLALGAPMPALGSGPSVAPYRLRLNAAKIKAQIDSGMEPDKAVQLANQIRTSQEGIKKLTSQHAQISAGETNITGALVVLGDELSAAKAKLIGSPKWDQFWSSKRTDWLGDPDFVGIAAAYKDIVESSSRVYSGVTGAGGTPVTFLQLAEKDVPEKPTLRQVAKLKDVMPKLFEIRKKATEDEIEKLSNLATLPTKAGGEKAPEAKASAPKATESTVKILQDNLPEQLNIYDKRMLSENPKTKERAVSDLRLYLIEMKKSKALKELSDAELVAKSANKTLQRGDVYGGKFFKGGVYKNKENWEAL